MKIYFTLVTGLIIIFSGLMFASTGQHTEQKVNNSIVIERTLESKTYKDIVQLLDEIGYTSERWQSGNREIPRIKILSIPQRWQKVSPTIHVNEKKSIFIRLISSGILQANEKILNTRNRLLREVSEKGALQNDWLHKLAMQYGVIKDSATVLNKKELDELLLRVDIVPVSLALAQGAIESGWGTSRFAVEGNSLFGQWDLSGNGIRPEKQRVELGGYGIARFDSPQASIDAYMLNLNTNRAYREFRAKRAVMRKQNKPYKGLDLVDTLGRYSERGDAYIKELKAIMRYNKLETADEAYLWGRGEVIISPVI